MDLAPHTGYKRCHFFVFLNSCLGPLPQGQGKVTLSHSCLNEQFETPGVYTIQENWSIWYMVTSLTCSSSKPSGQSRDNGSAVFNTCSHCPNSAGRTPAKAPALRLNLMPPRKHTNSGLTTTRSGLDTDPATFLSLGLKESQCLWDWTALLPFTFEPPPLRLPMSPEQHLNTVEWGRVLSKCRCPFPHPRHMQSESLGLDPKNLYFIKVMSRFLHTLKLKKV